jgi:hypothetical protein
VRAWYRAIDRGYESGLRESDAVLGEGKPAVISAPPP